MHFIMINKKLTSILITFLFIMLCDGNTLTFFEENLKPKTIITYPDNSVVFPYIGGCNSTNSNLRYRVLYPNGTSNLITVYDYDHQIPSFNFCDGIYFFETIPNYILITYNDKKGKDALVYAMMIDWSGKITR